MKKSVKWLLIGLALAVVVNVFSKGNTPKTPEEKAEQEQAALYAAAQKEYFAHPVILARDVAGKLEGINAKHTGSIQAAVQSFQQYAASKGRSPIDKRSVANAALDFDAMANAYAAFTVPMNLPDNISAALTGACADLKKSAQAGTEAFLELQRIVEGNPGSLPVANQKMSEATLLRTKGMDVLNKVKEQLASMPVPEYPQKNEQAAQAKGK